MVSDFGYRTDSRAYRKELEEQSILAIAELKFKDTVCADLRDRREPPCLEGLAQACDKGRGSGGGGSCKLGQMAAKASIDDELLLVIRLGELEQEDP